MSLSGSWKVLELSGAVGVNPESTRYLKKVSLVCDPGGQTAYVRRRCRGWCHLADLVVDGAKLWANTK